MSRLINEIVLAEESDEDPYGQYFSHFEMYYQAMNEAGADTKKIESFLNSLHMGVNKSLDKTNSPMPNKLLTIALNATMPIKSLSFKL